MKFILGFVAALLGAAAALFATYQVSGEHTLLWRWAFVLIALWLLHGAYLCRRAWSASRPLPLPEENDASASFCSRSVGYGWFVAHTLLPPAIMRWSTCGVLLLTLFIGIWGYTGGSQGLLFAAAVLLVLLCLTCLRRNVLLYRHLFGNHTCLRVHERGLLLMRPEKGKPTEDGLIVEWVSWHEVLRLYRLSGCVAFKLASHKTYYLPADTGMTKALHAIAPYFRRTPRNTSAKVYTLSTAYALIDRLAQEGALLQVDDAQHATPAKEKEHLGGVPDAGSSFSWPQNEGRPMTHWLQLRHESGLINIFIDTTTEQAQGESNRGAVRVVFTPYASDQNLTPSICPDNALALLLPLQSLRRTTCRFVPTFSDFARAQTAGPTTNATTYAAALAQYEGQRAPLAAQLAEGRLITGGLKVEGSATQCPVDDTDCYLLIQALLPHEEGNQATTKRLLTITLPRRDYAAADFSHIQWDITPFAPKPLA